jgi:Family of unknown function (DUF5681)
MAKPKCTDGRRNNRPPVSGQFKPGISPFPSGRPPNTRNRKTMIQSAFNAKISVTEKGRRRRISKFESGLIQLATKFALGDPKAFIVGHDLLHKHGLMEQETAAFLAQLSERDQPVLEDIIRRIREAAPPSNDQTEPTENTMPKPEKEGES